MDIEKLKYEAQNKALHIADVSGSALFNADCMDILPLIPDKSVQLILADLPYGTTACKWDSILPLDKLWDEYKRILKSNGAIVLTASQPFTTKLISSNYDWFKYEWIWDKCQCTNFYNAKKQPLKKHESILVFSKSRHKYYPQMEQITVNDYRYRKNGRNSPIKQGGVYGNVKQKLRVENGLRYPNSILIISNTNSKSKQHPTQKSLELIKYLIKTYSDENDYVLDNTMGVGTTCLGAKELNRKFIGIEKEVKYYDLAVARVLG